MTIGEKLRQAREAQSITLHDIAAKTNISVRFLDALEKGQIDKLPGGIFTRGFVRSYAAHVGLDPDATVREYVAAHPQIRTDEEAEEDQPPRSATPYVIAVLLLVVAALIAGYFWWATRRAVPTVVNAGPAVATGPVSAPAAPDGMAAGSMGAPAASLPPASEAPAVAAPVDGAVSDATPASSAGETPAESPMQSDQPLRLTLVPTGRCWVQVRADGRIRLAREVVAGERVDIDAAEVIEIVAGDAGAFGYRLNGAPGRALGSAGRVGRARITPANVAEFQQTAS